MNHSNGTAPDLSGLTRKGRRVAQALLRENLSEPPSYDEIARLIGEPRNGAVFKEVIGALWPDIALRRGRPRRASEGPPNDNIGCVELGRVNDLAKKYGGVVATLAKLREVIALHEDCRPLGGAAQVAEFLELLLSLQAEGKP